jgi:hypothetical protein
VSFKVGRIQKGPSLLGLVAAGTVMLAAGFLWGRRAPAGAGARDEAGWRKVSASAHVRSGADRGEGEALDAAGRQAARVAFWDGLGRRVDTEAVDPAWSRDTEATIRRVIPAELGPPVSVEARCASSICRATLTHPGWPRIPEDRFVQFTLNRQSLGTMEIQLDTRTEGTTTLYFIRR